jgi:hypothetical protein
MKIVKQLPAILLGLVFVIFGMAYFVPFMPAPPPMEGDMATYFGLMTKSGYMSFVKVLEIGIGLLLLLPKTRALALILIAPIVINILCSEVFIAKTPGLGIALVIINVIGLYFNKEKYKTILS